MAGGISGDFGGSGNNRSVVLGDPTNKLNVDLGGASRTSTVFAGDVLTVVNTVSNGSITKDGTGSMTLAGANTYGGGTTVGAGTLKVSGSGTLGSTSGALTVNGGTLDLNGAFVTVGSLSGSGGAIVNNASVGAWLIASAKSLRSLLQSLFVARRRIEISTI